MKTAWTPVQIADQEMVLSPQGAIGGIASDAYGETPVSLLEEEPSGVMLLTTPPPRVPCTCSREEMAYSILHGCVQLGSRGREQLHEERAEQEMVLPSTPEAEACWMDAGWEG